MAVVSRVGTRMSEEDAQTLLPNEAWLLNTCVNNTCAPSFIACNITEEIDFGMVLPFAPTMPPVANCPLLFVNPTIPRISSLSSPSDRVTCVTSELSSATPLIGEANIETTAFSHRKTFTTI